jgi:hypothetical protein
MLDIGTAGKLGFLYIDEAFLGGYNLYGFDCQFANLWSNGAGAAKRKMKTTTETQRTQRIAELEKGGKYRISFSLVLSVFSVPLW